MAGQSQSCKRLVKLWERLEIVDGVLYKHYEDVERGQKWKQLVVPQSLREEVLHELHAGVLSGHLGEEKTSVKVRQRFYWPGYSNYKDVRNWCRSCSSCATRKTSAPKNRTRLGTIKAGDKGVHGSSFADRDLVWLHSTVVPRGKSKKLHHPWRGPYRIISKLSNSDYKIKLPRSRKPPMVVHFNRLKLCSPDTRFTETTAAEICTPTHQPDQQPVGTELEIVDAVDDDDIDNDAADIPARRYPLRTRQPPARFAPTIEH